MEDISSLIIRLQAGEKVLCNICKKNYYTTNAKDVKESSSFKCDKCGTVIHCTPGNVIVE